jgi:hypothetical protein
VIQFYARQWSREKRIFIVSDWTKILD